MKKIFTLTLLCVFAGSLNAQFIWANRDGLWEYDYGYGIVNDNQGNVYVAGKYEQHAFFSPDSLPNRGNHDIYVAQYSPSGTLNWIKTAGGLGGDYAHNLTLDRSYSNSIYVTGEIEGAGYTISFDGSSATLQPVADNDIFLAKYDLNGNLLWAKSEGWKYSDKGLSVATDLNGNVYVSGYFTDTAKFNGTLLPGHGAEDIFVCKYDANGNFQWVKNAGSSGRDEGKSVYCDASGNVYVCGMYMDNANFSGQIVHSANGYFDTFLAKYDTNGNLQWVKTAGGNYDEVGWSLTIDNAGKIYVTGEFNAAATFDAIQVITSGNADVFVACYDNAGTVQWVSKAGGPLIDRARGIGTDGTNLFITGQFGATANFGSSQVSAADSSDIFIASLNNSGSFLWSTAVGGPPDPLETLGYESGNAVCAEAAGNVYATGSLLNGGTFGGISLSGYSRTDVFITRISTVAIGIKENSEDLAISLYPNPAKGSFMVDMSTVPGNAVIKVYNSLGMLIAEKTCSGGSQTNIDVSACNPGVYMIEGIMRNKTIMRHKLIVQD